MTPELEAAARLFAASEATPKRADTLYRFLQHYVRTDTSGPAAELLARFTICFPELYQSNEHPKP